MKTTEFRDDGGWFLQVSQEQVLEQFKERTGKSLLDYINHQDEMRNRTDGKRGQTQVPVELIIVLVELLGMKNILYVQGRKEKGKDRWAGIKDKRTKKWIIGSNRSPCPVMFVIKNDSNLDLLIMLWNVAWYEKMENASGLKKTPKKEQ